MNKSKNIQQVVAKKDMAPIEQEKTRIKLRRPDLPTREQLRQWAPLLAILLLGAVLRFWQLGMKPLHHDESLHAYFSLQLMHNLEQWSKCFNPGTVCYRYDPLTHGPFQFHIIALVYQLCQWLGAPDHGVNTTTVRIAAATLGTVIVGLPYIIRDYLGGRRAALIACFLLAISPSMVYYSRFAREDIYMACFTLLLIAAAGRYVRSRRRSWLVLGTAAFILSYATKEATFLSIAVFGSFLAGLLVWEIGLKIPVRSRFRLDSAMGRYTPRTAAPLGIACLLLLCAPLAKWLFSWMKELSTYINTNTSSADIIIKNLKNQTVALLPWLSLFIGGYVLVCRVREHFRKKSQHNRKGITAHTNPVIQPTLNAIVAMPWQHWFSALVVGSLIFVLLFSVIFTNMPNGLGDGIWQGLYYWLQQQQVARGGQPWYYYLLLFPFYEQIGLVFGIAGLVRSLRHPSRFRLFLIYWWAGTIGIYSWAGEKMPWLMIHMTMPMLLLAAIGLEPLFSHFSTLVKNGQALMRNRRNKVQLKRITGSQIGTLLGTAAAIFLLILTLQNMLQVTFVHYADGPHEMMIYVQTTTDIDTVMDKIDQLDEKLYHGQHKLNIGVLADASWPFYWYLRDYTNVCYGFPTGCASTNPEVIVVGGDDLRKSQSQYRASNTTDSASNYLFHRYHLRSWWDEGYKPKPCVPSSTDSCQGQPSWGGVGALLWLSYGDTPPNGALFSPPLAFKNIWDWWWTRKPFGGTAGATDMGFFIRSDLGVKP